MAYEREWRTDPTTGERFLALNSKQKHSNKTWRRREPDALDDVQTGNSLLTIWRAIRECHEGKRPPLRDDVMEKIVKGLRRTINESPNRRARFYAAAIVTAIVNERYDLRLGLRRPRRPKT